MKVWKFQNSILVSTLKLVNSIYSTNNLGAGLKKHSQNNVEANQGATFLSPLNNFQTNAFWWVTLQ